MKTKLIFLAVLFAFQNVLTMVAAQEPNQAENQKTVVTMPQQASSSDQEQALMLFDRLIAEFEGQPEKKEDKTRAVFDLIRAAEKNDVAAILAYQGDVNEMVDMPTYHYRLNALHAAIRIGAKEAVETLLAQKHADPNLCAVEIECAPEPCPRLTDDNENLFWWNQHKIFTHDKRNPLQWVFEKWLIDSIRMGVDSANHNNEDIAILLLKFGANPNVIDASGYPLIYYAAQKGAISTALAMMEAGADPEKEFTIVHVCPPFMQKYKQPDETLNAYQDVNPKTFNAMKAFAFNRVALAFAAISHRRCGVQSAWHNLSVYDLQKIINNLRPVMKQIPKHLKCFTCTFSTDDYNEFKKHFDENPQHEFEAPLKPQ